MTISSGYYNNTIKAVRESLSEDMFDKFKDEPVRYYCQFEKALELTWVLITYPRLFETYVKMGDDKVIDSFVGMLDVFKTSMTELSWFMSRAEVFYVTLLNNRDKLEDINLLGIQDYLQYLRMHYSAVIGGQDLILADGMSVKYTVLFPDSKYLQEDLSGPEGLVRRFSQLSDEVDILTEEEKGEILDSCSEEERAELKALFDRLAESKRIRDEANRRVLYHSAGDEIYAEYRNYFSVMGITRELFSMVLFLIDDFMAIAQDLSYRSVHMKENFHNLIRMNSQAAISIMFFLESCYGRKVIGESLDAGIVLFSKIIKARPMNMISVSYLMQKIHIALINNIEMSNMLHCRLLFCFFDAGFAFPAEYKDVFMKVAQSHSDFLEMARYIIRQKDNIIGMGLDGGDVLDIFFGRAVLGNVYANQGQTQEGRELFLEHNKRKLEAISLMNIAAGHSAIMYMVLFNVEQGLKDYALHLLYEKIVGNCFLGDKVLLWHVLGFVEHNDISIYKQKLIDSITVDGLNVSSDVNMHHWFFLDIQGDRKHYEIVTKYSYGFYKNVIDIDIKDGMVSRLGYGDFFKGLDEEQFKYLIQRLDVNSISEEQWLEDFSSSLTDSSYKNISSGYRTIYFIRNLGSSEKTFLKKNPKFQMKEVSLENREEIIN